MGDVGDIFSAMKKAGQDKRASNREKSPQMLEASGILFEIKNKGAHLVVEGDQCYIDFWPGTGKWKSRNGKEGFGVRNLINHIIQ